MTAVILVDLQNDFMPGGVLAVPKGDEVVAIANEMMGQFDLVIASQDWHPTDHSSFASQHPGRQPGDQVEVEGLTQTLWPDHCVQGTKGAALSEELHLDKVDHFVKKGVDRSIDSYSAFFDNARRRATGLAELLDGVEAVTVLGLATDYCVKFTALDAVSLGFDTKVALRSCRGIDLWPGDIDQAAAEMKDAGVQVC